MPKTQLTCPCGWVFFVPEIGPAGVDCPHCGKLVEGPRRVRAHKNATTVAAEHGERQRQTRIVLWSVVGSVFALGLLAGVVIFRKPGEKKDPAIKLIEEVETTRWGSQKPATDAGKPNLPPDFTDYKRLVDHGAWTANVAGVLAELMRLRGAPGKAEELERRMETVERDIETCLDKLREKNTEHAVPEHLMAGDRLLFFRGVDFAKAGAADRDKAIANAIRSIKVGEMWDMTVQRGADTVGFMAYFKEKPRPMIALIEQYRTVIGNLPPPAELAAEPEPPPPGPGPSRPAQGQPQPPGGIAAPTPVQPPPPPQATAIAADVLAAVREKFYKLPAYYQNFLTPDERVRLDGLMREGKGLAEDHDFIQRRVLLEAVTEVADERDFIRSQIVELKEKATKVVAQNDLIIKRDGSRLEGKILEDRDDVVKIEIQRGGVKGSVSIPRADISTIAKSGGPAGEFAAKHAEAAGKAGPLAALAAWCKEKGLADQLLWVSWQILDLDPSHEASRVALGYQKSDLVWTKERKIERKGDQIVYAGKSYTPAEFTAMLKNRGYVEMNGQWYGRKPWGYKISNLYRDEDKLRASFKDTAVYERVKTEKTKVYDVTTKTYKDNYKRTNIGRLIGPTGAGHRKGSVTLTVEAPGDFIDCKVRAVSEIVVSGAYVKVTVANESGTSKELYTLNVSARNDKLYDVSEIARGYRKIYVTAEMSGPYISADTGTTGFLQCTKNDSCVFEVSGQIAEPLQGVNQVLQGVPMPPAESGTGLQGEREIQAVADRALLATEGIHDLVSKIQDGTKLMKYAGVVSDVTNYSIILKHVTDPLTFSLSNVDAGALTGIGSWWNGLSTGEKQGFARHFALMCAAARYRQGK